MDLILETERLYMLEMRLEDAPALLKMDSNPAVHTYLWQTPITEITEIEKYISYVRTQYEKHKIGRFSTFLKTTDELIGWTGIKFVDDHIENGKTNFYDYGYRLNQNFWNKGYATEASIAWLNYAFNNMQIEELNAYTHAKNGASNCILGKIGMTEMQTYPDENGVNWKWWQVLAKNYKDSKK